MRSKKLITPFVLPPLAFAITIVSGAIVLALPWCASSEPVAFIDALFISTSAVCVTGLASVDVAVVFNYKGHLVMMALMQLGGIGIITYSSLIFYVMNRKISLTDRLAVGQVLLHDRSFNLGKFLQRIVLYVLAAEIIAFTCLYMMEPDKIGPFNAAFLSISSFCNAGFALWTDNLIGWQYHWGVNIVVMAMITLGGLGFAVMDECLQKFKHKITARLSGLPGQPFKLSYVSRLVLVTSFALTFGGALLIYFSESLNPQSGENSILTALFQSVTCRTAGFSSMHVDSLTNLTLTLMMILMFIGASPGSCGGGIKTTTFRVLGTFALAQLRGRSQAVLQGRAIAPETVHKALVLFMFSVAIIMLAILLLMFTESSTHSHDSAQWHGIDFVFETISAFGTVGLSTGVTPELSSGGKAIISAVMYIGRLGPIWLITTLAMFSSQPRYSLPEVEVPIG